MEWTLLQAHFEFHIFPLQFVLYLYCIGITQNLCVCLDMFEWENRLVDTDALEPDSLGVSILSSRSRPKKMKYINAGNI